MPGEYAAKTDVPVSRSCDEIERTLARFGATGFAFFTQPPRMAIAFEITRIRIMLHMTLPDRQAFALDSRGRRRIETAIEKDWEQACRQRWRTLAAAIKAKLAMIVDGISTIEATIASGTSSGEQGRFIFRASSGQKKACTRTLAG